MWRIGSATRDITPPAGVVMSPTTAREFPAIGAHDPLQLKALTLEPAQGDPLAVLALDLIGTDAALTQRIREGVEARVGQGWGRHLVVGCTHTHAGPAMLPSAYLGQTDADYFDFLVDMAAEAVAEGLANAQNGSLRFGSALEPAVTRNRRVKDGPTDPQVSVLRAENRRGEVLALLVCYACHPTVLGPTNFLYSADYPGVVRQTLEQIYGGTTLFLTGCAGQLNVGHDSYASFSGKGFSKRNYDEVERIGRMVAASAMRATELAVVCPDQGRLVQQGLLLPLDSPHSANELELMRERWAQERQQALTGYGGSVRMLEGMIAWSEWVGNQPVQSEVTVEVQAYALGSEQCLVFVPGESFVEIGLGIKEACGVPSLVASYCNQVVGYIPYPDAYPQGGYEVDMAYMMFGYPAPYQPQASLELMQASSQAALRALGKS